MELVLAIATVLGGIAAILYFAERLGIREQAGADPLPQRGLPPEIPNPPQATLRTKQDVIGVFSAAAHEWHNAGSVVCDDEASEKRASVSDFRDRGGYVVYGPYVKLRVVSVSGNWRVTFKFVGKDADSVDYEDYH